MSDATLFEWTTWGRDSGGCGHRHRSPETVASCLDTARKSFRRAGTYCDRKLVLLSPGEDLPVDPVETDDPALGYARTLQERLLEEPYGEWAMLIGCVLLNRTNGLQVERIVWDLLDRWPTPRALARADTDLEELIRPLGLWRRRAENMRSFSGWWVRCGWGRSKRWLPARDRLLEAPGLGPYAVASYRVFVLGEDQVETEDSVLLAAQKSQKPLDSRG